MNDEIINVEGEEWRTIKGFDRYMVSNFGRVKKLPRYGITWVLMNDFESGRLVKDDKLWLYDNNHKETGVKISSIVAEAFLADERGKRFVWHKNGNLMDNRPENLYYDDKNELIELAKNEKYKKIRLDVLRYINEGMYVKDICAKTGLAYNTLMGYIEKDHELKDAFEAHKEERKPTGRDPLMNSSNLRVHPVGRSIRFSEDERIRRIREFPYNRVSDKGFVYTYVEENKEYYINDYIDLKDGPVYLLMNNFREQIEIPADLLVAICFVEKMDEAHTYVLHKDGNIKNNKASNLRWITTRENSVLKEKKRMIKGLLMKGYASDIEEAIDIILTRYGSKKQEK